MKSMQDVSDQVSVPQEENRENAVPAGSNAPSTEILPSTCVGSIHSFVSKSSLSDSSGSSSRSCSVKSFKVSPSLSFRRRARLLPKAHKLGGKNRPIIVCGSSSCENRAPSKGWIEKNDPEHSRRNGSKDTTLEVSSPQSEPIKALSELRRLQICIFRNLSNSRLERRKGKYSARSKKSKPLCVSGGSDVSGLVDILPVKEGTSGTKLSDSHTTAGADVGFDNETAKSQESSKRTGIENGNGSRLATPSSSRYASDNKHHAIKRADISNALLFLAPAVDSLPILASQGNNDTQGKTASSCSLLHGNLSSGPRPELNYDVYKPSAYQRIRSSAPPVRHEDLKGNPRITEKELNLIEACLALEVEMKGGQVTSADDKIDLLRKKYIRRSGGKLARFGGPTVHDPELTSYSRLYCCHSHTIRPPSYIVTSKPGSVIRQSLKVEEGRRQEVLETPLRKPEMVDCFTSGDGSNNAHLGSAEDRMTKHDIGNRRRQAKYLRGGLGQHDVEEFRVAAIPAHQTVNPRTWAKAGQLEAQLTGRLVKMSLTLGHVVFLFKPIATASKLFDIILYPLKLVWRIAYRI